MSAGSRGGCEGARGHSRTFSCALSLALSLSFSFLSLSLPGGRPGPRRRRRGKESVMRRGCSMALRDMEVARPRHYREPGGTRHYREPAAGTRPCPRPGGSGGAGLGNRPWAPSAAATFGHCHPRGGPRPPPRLAPPGCHRVLSPPHAVPASSRTVTSAAVPVTPRALSPPSQCSLFPWQCHSRQ